jgi:hypothetical protein
MKTIHLIFPAIAILFIATALLINPFNAFSQNNNAKESFSIPDSVAQILSKSCIGCHDLGGSKMASSKWSFSAWDKYNKQRQAKKSDAMCNALTKEDMPPPSARKSNPERIPSSAQIEIICKWANSLKKK